MKTLFLLCTIALATAHLHAQFVHPGMLHTKKDLDFLRSKVKAGAAPWADLWNELKTSKEADLGWKPQPIKVIVVGFFSKPDIGATAFTMDANAAYTMALAYYVTKDKAYAEKVIEIINAWTYTLDSITDKNKKLLLGMNGIKYLNAAEIIRYTYKGWKKQDQQAFEKMALNNWYPLLQDFMPSYNGNWDAAIIQTMMCIGIFCDRQDIFDRAYNQCLKGASNGAINNYFTEWGQCQESGRDQGHTQMGLGFLSTVCEIAWKQGLDLYASYQNRLATGYEYTAKYLLGEEVKYVRYTTFENKQVFADTISSAGRGKFSPIYERAYHHYHDRLGMEMPFTTRALNKSRIEGNNRGFMPWASLMNQGYPLK
ncbi:MAG: alginate lyase family protein [Chitinophagaceae bacterium]